jgi:hypothetical protein
LRWLFSSPFDSGGKEPSSITTLSNDNPLHGERKRQTI